MNKWILIYLAVVNLLAFAMYGIDKRKAQIHAWRISEKALFIVAFMGGSLGAVIGMHLFHHKTRHWYFRYGLPAVLLLQVALAVLGTGYLT